jgi:transposase
VDWSWDRQAVCVIDDEGVVLDRFEVQQRARALAGMTQRLHRWGVRRVAIERPDGPVVEVLLGAGLEVVVISPRQVRAFRLRHGTAGNKDDRFDAYVLADALRTDGHRIASLVPDRDDTRRSGRSFGPARTSWDIGSRCTTSCWRTSNMRSRGPSGCSPSSTARSR